MQLPEEIVNKILLFNIHPNAELIKDKIHLYNWIWGPGTICGKSTELVKQVIKNDKWGWKHGRPKLFRYIIIDTYTIPMVCFHYCVLNRFHYDSKK